MPNREDIKFEWWKLACEKSPSPIAFLCLDNKFIFCNNAWCKLLGYSESELKEKTWKDITKIEDIGSDQSEVDAIISGEKEEYYLEKSYIRKDRTSVSIKLYIHKYPESGDHEGYIAFAKRLTSEDYEDLKSKFLDLQKTVLILQQNAVASDFIARQMQIIEQKVEQNKEIAKMAMERNNINIGDKFGDSGSKAGRDNISGSNNNNIILIISIVIFSFLLITLLSSLIIYLVINNPAQ